MPGTLTGQVVRELRKRIAECLDTGTFGRYDYPLVYRRGRSFVSY